MSLKPNLTRPPGGPVNPDNPGDASGPRGPDPVRARLSTGLADALFRFLCQAAALLVIGLAILFIAVLVWRSWLAINTLGTSFFTTSVWDPEPTHREFGALAFVYGTVITSLIAMVVAIPFGVGTAAFLSEVAPHWLRKVGAFFVEMLAAIPSVVYGFWGLYVFSPVLRKVVVLLGGPDQAGIGLLSAGLVLGIMVIPYIAAVSFDVIRAVPRSQREGSLALGATRWQTIWMVVLPYARPGIIGGCFLALGRALGETMAVTMLIGNRSDIVFSLFAKGNSIPSVIANEFTEATYDLYLSALAELGLVLLVVSVGFSAFGRLLIWRMTKSGARGFSFSRIASQFRSPKTPSVKNLDFEDSILRQVKRSSSVGVGRYAHWIDRLMAGGNPATIKLGVRLLGALAIAFTATAFLVEDPAIQVSVLSILAIAACATVLSTMGILGFCQMATSITLFLIVGYLLVRGATALNWNLFVKLPTPVGQTGGGMANAFYGSALMIGIATAFSVPVGLLTAIYLAEYRSTRLGGTVRFIAEMLGSVPSIVIGIFGYYAVVKPITHHFSGLAGGFALGVMMLPIVIRASEEALKLVPSSLRHASYALGASQWQTVVRVSVPAALPAIITAVFLSIARVAGETAPLLLTASSNTYWPRSLNDYTPSVPVYIFTYAVSPYDDWHRQAWAAAFVLVSAIMVLNVSVRLLGGKRIVAASSAD